MMPNGVNEENEHTFPLTDDDTQPDDPLLHEQYNDDIIDPFLSDLSKSNKTTENEKYDKIQKKYETATKLILEGMYKEKIDFNKLKNKNEIYDINKNPVPDNWFENKEEKKEAKIIIYYGSVKEEDGYFFPIWINIT